MRAKGRSEAVAPHDPHGSGPEAGSRWLCGGAIAVAVALGALHVAGLAGSLQWTDLPLALLGVLVGALAADALTGLVHWACDTWGDERTPWLGPTLIYAFREHHAEPNKMLAHPWTVTNREPGCAAALALLLGSLPPVRAVLETRPFLYAALLALVAWGAAANQLHWWAHAPRAPRPVRWAQRAGLVLSPAHHARHHASGHDAAYCISTGWLNPLLDRARVWRGLERTIQALSGTPPRAGLEPGRSRSG